MITADEIRDLMPSKDILNNYPDMEILIRDAAQNGNNRIEYVLMSSHLTFCHVLDALRQLGYTVFREKFYINETTHRIESHLIIAW